MTLRNVSLAFALSMVLSAAAQAGAGRSDADLAEAGAPDSVLNKDGAATVPVDRAHADAQVRDAERGNPDSTDERSARPPMAVDRRTQAAEVEAAEARNPDSVESRR